MSCCKYASLHTCGSCNSIPSAVLWLMNRHPDSATRGPELVVFAVHNLIAVADVRTSSIVCTLKAQSGVITSLSSCYLRQSIAVVAASEDGCILVWKHRYSSSITEWRLVEQQLTGLLGAVSSSSSCSLQSTSDAFVVAAADFKGSLLVWHIISGSSDIDEEPSPMTSIQIISKIKFPSAQMAKSIHICELPTGDSRSPPCLTIFIGSVDSRIHIYVAKDGIQLPTNGSRSGSTTEAPSHLELFSCVGILPGHEEWVVCLAAVAIDCRTTMLASGSQDAKIRVWKIKATKVMDAQGSYGNSILEQVTAFDEDDDETDGEQSADIPAAALTDDDNMDESRLQFCYCDDILYSLYLESLLVGHEDWVTALQWMPQVSTQSSGSSSSSAQQLRLFSTSMDRNMVVWAPDTTAGGIWVPVVRMGDIGGALGGSIGGNLLGFVAGSISPDCSSVLGVGYGGSFHLWRSVASSDYLDTPDTRTESRWIPVPFLTGHFGSVNDLTWSDSEAGEYLVSVSSDQTCRLHAPLADGGTWREISRPQIHGYDLNCVAKVMDRGSHIVFTGGEEKIIREFSAPEIVLTGLRMLCNIDSGEGQVVEFMGSSSTCRVQRAYIPELGLSNKACDAMTKAEMKEQLLRGVSSLDWRDCPLESQLSDYTLWPEIRKLFGHANEVMCVSISPDSHWMASCCKARDALTAQIVLWRRTAAVCDRSDGGSMEIVRRLAGHESTVVCLQFSPDSRYLLSAGKDRAIFIHDVQSPQRVLSKPNAHKRIIWDCSWFSDSQHVVTVSRDGACKIWRATLQDIAAGEDHLICVKSFSPFDGTSITAVDVASASMELRWVVAVGSEKGDMKVYRLDESLTEASLLLAVPAHHSHGATVRRLRWRARALSGDQLEWASCGEDRTLRVHRLMMQ